MGKKSKKRDVNESRVETTVMGAGLEQNDLPESKTSTDLQSKQKSHTRKTKKQTQDIVSVNIDSGSTAPDEHFTITKRSSKKRSKHGIVEEAPHEVTPLHQAKETGESNSSPAKQKHSKKNKKTNESEGGIANNDSDDQVSFEIPPKVSTGSSRKNKKIIFDDDTGVEVTPRAPNNPDKKKQNFNPEEDEVKDEDIDQFCEDIPEEENAQFEDWVKLIEAKLGSNKK